MVFIVILRSINRTGKAMIRALVETLAMKTPNDEINRMAHTRKGTCGGSGLSLGSLLFTITTTALAAPFSVCTVMKSNT